MKVELVTGPAIEPVTIGQAKKQLRYDGGTFADQVTSTQSIAPGSHVPIGAYGLVGTGVNVLGYDAIVLLESGENGVGATVDVKIQESDDDVGANYLDWSGKFDEIMTLDVAPGGAGWAAGDTITGVTSTQTCVIVTVLSALTYMVKDRSGTFTLNEILTNGTDTADQGAAHPTFHHLTTDNDNATYERAYTGVKQYIRVVSTVTDDACEFGVSVVKNAPTSAEDSLITDLITSAREHVEDILRRKLITQTWKYYLQEWPPNDFIKIPFGNLQDNAKATGTITSSGVNVSANDTVTIDTKVYTFVAVPATEGDVKIGADAAASLDNLKAAINHSGTPGTDYYCVRAHPTVEATTNTDTVQTLQALIGGVAGNSIALAKSAVTLTVSATTLTGAITTLIVKYKDSDGLETIIDVTTDYLIEQNGTQCGKIVLPYGETWPSGTLYPSNPITIQFVCGWTTAALVPFKIKAAILQVIAKLFESRGEDVIGQSVYEDKTVLNLLQSRRLFDEFI